MPGKFLRILVLVTAAGFGSAWAQDYPVRPVKIVVPFPPGGVPDVLGRALGQPLSEALGQQFIVENRPGAGGITAYMFVVKSPADGYTLLVGDTGGTAANPHLFSKLPYDTLRDLAPVSIIVNSIQYLAGSPQFATFNELIAYAKANPGKLSYGSAGIGSLHHIGMESIKAAFGVNMVHVPYKGSSLSVPALVSGEVQAVISSLPSLSGHAKSGKVKVLAVTSLTRSPLTPDVPAVAEFIPGYDFTSAVGFLAPAGTPAPILSKLAAEVAKAVKQPELAARLTSLGLTPVGSTPEAYTQQIRSDLERYAVAVKISGAKAD